MNLILTWLRNNLVTVIEIVDIIFDSLEVLVNGLLRIIPGNRHVQFVHDILAKIQQPLNNIKSFLLLKVGS